MTKTCVLTGDTITPATDSKAHIIASALGGRLKPLGLLTKNANGLLGGKFDGPLIEAFQPIMSLLGGSRDRGDNPPTRMKSAAGETFLVSFGEPIKPTVPQVDFELTPQGLRVDARAASIKDLRTILGKVKAQHPEFDIEKAIQHAERRSEYPDGRLHSQIQIGPAVTFPAAFIAASLFAAHCGLAAHPEFPAYANRFDPDAEPRELPPDTFYWYPDGGWHAAPAEVAHVVALHADPKRKRALVAIDYFNIISVGVTLPFDGREELHHAYAVDVLTGTENNPAVRWPALAETPWSATHQHGNEDVFGLIQPRLSRLIGIAQARGHDAEVSRIINDTLGPVDGRRGTREDVRTLAENFTKYVLSRTKP